MHKNLEVARRSLALLAEQLSMAEKELSRNGNGRHFSPGQRRQHSHHHYGHSAYGRY